MISMCINMRFRVIKRRVKPIDTLMKLRINKNMYIL